MQDLMHLREAEDDVDDLEEHDKVVDAPSIDVKSFDLPRTMSQRSNSLLPQKKKVTNLTGPS